MYVTNELNNLRGGQVELNGIIPIHIIHTDMDFKKELISNMVKVVSHFTYPDIYIYMDGVQYAPTLDTDLYHVLMNI
mgnify:FL=1